MKQSGPTADSFILQLSSLTITDSYPLAAESAYLLKNRAEILANLEQNQHLYKLAERSFLLLENGGVPSAVNQWLIDINCAIVLNRVNPASVVLDCKKCMITRIPSELFKAPELGEYWKRIEVINFSNNQLQSLPEEIKLLKRLTKIDFSFNLFEKFPSVIKQFAMLRELNFRSNRLKTLPRQITRLKKLFILYLDGNEIEAIPGQITDLKYLTMLEISRNKIKSLPPEIGKVEQLTHLWLKLNQLTDLPDEIGLMKNIRVLDVSANKLSTLPKAVGKLSSLKRLCLEDNPLPYEIIEKAEKDLDAFRKLYNNSLTILPTELKRPMSQQQKEKLRRISLRYEASRRDTAKLATAEYRKTDITLQHYQLIELVASNAPDETKLSHLLNTDNILRAQAPAVTPYKAAKTQSAPNKPKYERPTISKEIARRISTFEKNKKNK